jgi:hypothetical protein
VNALPHRSDGLGLRHFLLLLGVFLATRIALFSLGLRFHLDLAWMFLADPDALRERLLETVYYFHAFAPGMNLITGLLLKLSSAHLSSSAAALFWASGYLLLIASCQLFHLLGCSKWTSMLLALGLSLVPQSLYLENLYLYTHLCTSLGCWAAVAFHRALASGSARSWFSFFLVCAVLGWLYTAFHLFWFLLLAALAFSVAGRGRRRAVLLGGAAPLLLLSGLYLKNYAVFGVFNATSWGGANVTLATTQFMDGDQRREWIDNGKLSPFAEISVFAGPDAYLPYFPADLHFPWPTTNELTKPALDAPNFNHGIFLQVNRQRQKDASYFIRQQPRQYLSTVLERNLPNMFSSTTHWHEADQTAISPHYDHRRVLGRYESFYDKLVHSWPQAPVGLYWFLPLFYLWALWSCWKDSRSSQLDERSRGLLLGFCLLQIAFVVTASSLFSSLESARYRYGVEPFIWAVVAVGLRAAVHRFGSGLSEFIQKRQRKDKIGIAAGPSASS